jgi:hypothetical protein
MRDSELPQALRHLCNESDADPALTRALAHEDVVEMTADRGLVDDGRQGIADGLAILLRDQHHTVADRLLDIGGDRFPRLLQEVRLRDLALELVAKLPQSREVGLRSGPDCHEYRRAASR